MTDNWQLFSFPDLEKISQARDQFHQAIQNVAAVGRFLSPKSSGDEFANLEWNTKLQRLVGQWVEGNQIFRSSISLIDFEVYLVDKNVRTISSIQMQDIRQTDVMVWLEHELSQLGTDFSKINLSYPYEIPEYPTAKREAFHVDDMEAAKELSRAYYNTSIVLSKLLTSIDNTSTIKCWPHHFDLATTVTLLDTGDPETSRSVSLGMSPGDKYYDEPYFYVSPWPYPMNNLLDISEQHAHWHQEDWVGAVLPYAQLKEFNLIQDQRRSVATFYEMVFNYLKNLH